MICVTHVLQSRMEHLETVEYSQQMSYRMTDAIPR